MKKIYPIIQKIGLLVGAILIVFGLLFMFFGGTWEGARIGLEIFGGLYLLETAYKSLQAELPSQSQNEQKNIDEIIIDAYYDKARAAVIEYGAGSSALLQRKLQIDYPTAAALIDRLEERGVIGPADSENPRSVVNQ